MQVTATIENWFFDHNDCVQGNIYGDIHNRWTDGTFIRTSFIVDVKKEEGLVITRNSVYKLGKKLETKSVSWM